MKIFSCGYTERRRGGRAGKLASVFSADSIKRSVCQESDPNAIFLHLLQCHGCIPGQDLGRAGVNKIQVTQYQV